MTTKIKPPDAVLDFVVDWSDWLETGEVIASSTMTPEDGITKDSDTHDDTTATVWLSGGTLGKTYHVRNVIVTDQDRTQSHVIIINCQDLTD